jgi:UDP-glucose 4-epimerase
MLENICAACSTEDESETGHLRSLEGSEGNLELFQADLLDQDALDRAIGKSNGVFHVASPCTLDPPKDAQVIS